MIASRGLERVTFRAVADQAGFAPSTTSYFFSSVDDVIDAAITQVAETVVIKVRTLTDRVHSGELDRDSVALALTELVSTQDTGDTTAQFEAYLAVRRRPDLQPSVDRIIDAIELAASEAVSALGVAEPEAAARQFIAVIDGFTLAQMAQPERARIHAQNMRATLLRLMATYDERTEASR